MSSSRFNELLNSTLTSSGKESTSPHKKELPTFCVFCKNNGEEAKVYKSHILKTKDGKVICPVLFNYQCPKCGNSGHNAHTLRYCPYAEKNVATQQKICQELMPFRKLEQLDCNSNKISKTEIDEFDFETEDHYWWENFQDEGSFSDAFLIGQILAPFPPLVQHNILQLYNVWNSQ